jgi:carbamoyltransferase
MPGHNACVGVFKNGECLAIYQEEKFVDQKNFTGFPVHAFALGVKLLDGVVDLVPIAQTYLLPLNVPGSKNDLNEKPSKSLMRDLFDWVSYHGFLGPLPSYFRNFVLKRIVSPRSWESLRAYLEATYGIKGGLVVPYDHHLSHCVTPVAFYGLDKKHSKILLLSMDGAGDNLFSKTCTLDAKNGLIEVISQSHYKNSIGMLYTSMTSFLGMKPSEHEYKVMGLAAYVTESKYYAAIYSKLARLISFDSNTLQFKSKFDMSLAVKYFKKTLSGERFDNMAAATQQLTEDLVLKWVTSAIKKTGISTIACSGGVFMNVKLNQRIANLSEVEKVYFQPSCGDESHVIGSAYLGAKEHGEKIEQLNSMYFGHRYGNKNVEEFIKLNKLDSKYLISFHIDIETKIAKLLADHQIVARFKGAGEWGARSLCNRGILGNASDLKTFYYVNDMIKMRDFWMPFAPTILDSYAPKYIKNWEVVGQKMFESLRYMIVTVDATDLAKDHLRAAIHQKDHTLRPQIVTETDNKDLYRLLSKYHELTNMGGIMNTSFNLHGSPLVGTLEQAASTFDNSGLRHLALENYLLTKRD